MKTRNIVIGFIGVVTSLACVASGQTIHQSGGSGTTYTDQTGDHQGSANLLRDISFLTVANDANNLYFTIGINPGGNLATGGAFNYVIGMTSGSLTAGGDTSAASDHGNAYGRAISFDSSFGGMTDWVGVFGAGGSGTTGSPYTSYGFNVYAYGTPASTGITLGAWTRTALVSSGQPMSDQPSTSIPNEIALTIPLTDFANNFNLTPGTIIDFDLMSTGTSGNQTAYDSLVVQGPIQGTYSSTAQYNATALDQYTVTATPEPGMTVLAGLGAGLALIFSRRKQL